MNEIRESTNDTTWHEDIGSRLEVVRNVETEVKIGFSGARSYLFADYTEPKIPSQIKQKLVGYFKLKEMTFRLSPEESIRDEAKAMTPEEQIVRANLSRKESVSQFICKGISTRVFYYWTFIKGSPS